MSDIPSTRSGEAPAPAGERWTVSGMSPQAKHAAREAARRERLPLGVWLERAIRHEIDAGPRRGRIIDPQNTRPNRRYF